MAVGFNDTALNAMADHLATLATHARLYTAEPNAAGTTNQASSGLQAVTWDAAANGDITITADEAFTGGAASGSCTHVGFWNSAGTVFYGYFLLTGDTTFNSAGEYTLTNFSLTGTAT